MLNINASNYLFRVDSSNQIGSGHVIRCLTLAQGLRNNGANCTFLSRNLDGNINHLICKKDFQLIELPRPIIQYKNYDYNIEHSAWSEVSWEQDAEETINCIKKNNFNKLVVDHYAFSHSWETRVSKYIKDVIVIDDLGDREHFCNYLLDQNLGSSHSKYLNLIPKDCKTLIGTEYALIRPEFIEHRNESIDRNRSESSKRILINFGGGDPKNYISKILKSISVYKISTVIKIDIILGAINYNLDECYNLAKLIPNEINFFHYLDNMSETLIKTDLVIGAAGSSSWERCCMGIPSIIFSLAKNQNNIAKALSDSGAALLLDESSIENGRLIKEIERLINSNELLLMSKRASEVVDGCGVKRVIGALNE